MRRLARQPSGMFDQGLLAVLCDVSGEHGGAYLPAILTGAELEKCSRRRGQHLRSALLILRSSNVEPE